MFNKLIVVSLTVSMLAVTPLATFAKSDSSGDDGINAEKVDQWPKASGRSRVDAGCANPAPACPSPQISNCRDGKWICVGPAQGGRFETLKEGKAVRMEIKNEIKNFHAETNAEREAFKMQMEQGREKFKMEMEQDREAFKMRIGKEREDLKTKIESEREALKEKLKEIKDTRKADAVGRIGDELNNLNTRRLNHLTEVLNKLDEILVRITTRADKAAANSKDVTAVKSDVDAAKAAIAAARSAIETQSKKIYTVNVTTEQGLKAAVGEARKMLHDDLSAVQDKVKAARDAVYKAAVDLGQVPHVDDEDENEAGSAGSLRASSSPENTSTTH